MKITANKTKEIFQTIADGMEIKVGEVKALFESGDKSIVRLVTLAVRMDK